MAKQSMTDLEFVALHRENLQPVMRYLARRVDRQDIDPLLNEVFSIAWTKRQQCPAGYELPWLLRIASLLVKNHLRKQRTQPVFLELKPELALDDDRSGRTPGAGRSEHMNPGFESHLLSNRLVASWNKLSQADREVLALVAFEDLDAKSLAQSLGTSVNAATIRLSRARKKLLKLMKEFESD